MDEDAYSDYDKQYRLLGLILRYDELCRSAMDRGAELGKLFAIHSRELVGRAKMILPGEYEREYERIEQQIKAEIEAIVEGGDRA